ncbi:MAG: phenylalanine--tRNA ligase subunit beta [Gammaproteobacteria bacterium]|nr:phenylalanine--tRNA ligase subunit beta [Gammaproteobacteria bacterium]
MRINEGWLRAWVNPPISTEALAERLTMAGLELACMWPAAPAFQGVVVARVTDVWPHPHTESLKLCRVDDGGANTLTVVCGAPDVEAGWLAAFARVGAELPEGRRVEALEVQGVESRGMLCSACDLGLAETSESLLRLDGDAQIGQSIRDHLGLDDKVMEIELTPNRADCLCIAGMAREVAALTGTVIRGMDVQPVPAIHEHHFPVSIEAPADCPRYAGRVIRSIATGRQAPLWMRERLRRCGLRSIDPVVDVTNYVMLELGQPMHAFDLGRLTGGIRVRQANDGEKLTLLGDQEIKVAAGTLLIADHARPLALAGIMGGQDSAVGVHTRDIFLESAHFSPGAIAGRARIYGLATESSHRFERGVDPELQVKALERATGLLLGITGGDAGPVQDVVSAEHLPSRGRTSLRPTQVARVLGVSIPTPRISEILRSLGCALGTDRESLWVVPPSCRFDLRIEADLIEEVGRVYGYDHIPATIAGHEPIMRINSGQDLRRLRTLLVDRGYQEAITYSFVDAETNKLFNPGRAPLRVTNPISADLSVMRTSLWPGLVKAAQYNFNRQQSRVKLFEFGQQFVDTEHGLQQTPMLAGLVSGDMLPEQWGATARAVDFFDVKADVEALLGLAGLSGGVHFEPDAAAALHPGQAARIVLNDKVIGRLGAVQPALERRLDLPRRVFLWELETALLRRNGVAPVQEISRFPAIRRDIAIIVDEAVTATQVTQCVIKTADDLLRDVYVFDVYRGYGVAAGRKSLALGLILQGLTRTLTDKDVDAAVSHIVTGLAQRLGATLRV